MIRQLGRELEKKWGKPVVVENRSGAMGTIGASSVARAEANGVTCGLGNTGAHLDRFVGEQGRAYAELIRRLDIKQD